MPGISIPSVSLETLAPMTNSSLETLERMGTGATGRPIWPSDITGLILWLPADQIQGIASGASLSNWTDSSASLSHATQPSAVSQPKYYTNVQNGLSATSWGDGIGQIMVSNTSITDVCTLCLVGMPSLTTTTRIVGSNNNASRIVNSGNSWAFSRGGTSVSPIGAVVGVWRSVIAFADTANSICTLTVSQSVTSSSNATSGQTSTDCRISSSLTFAGYLGEICVYDRNLFESERSQLNAYFRTKWAV